MLAATNYHATLAVNLTPGISRDAVQKQLVEWRANKGPKRVRSERPVDIPARYWVRLVDQLRIPAEAVWSELSTRTLSAVANEITSSRFEIAGKGTFKDEFVTSGGVRLGEVDFRTMQSRVVPGLYLAGEVLDIDGITGGFNFQSAWTTGWIAGSNML